MNTAYKVLGMTCEGCARSLENAIKAAAPGADIRVDLDGNRFTITGFDDVDAIAEAVGAAGFEFGGKE